MARDGGDVESASPGGQSQRTPSFARDSDSHSDATSLHSQGTRPRLPQQPSHLHQRQHHVGRVHARVPSSKALHKQHAAVAAPKLNRRITSPDSDQLAAAATAQSHRRATSEVKLPRDHSASHLTKSASHTSFGRNRSHGDLSKRAKSAEKLKRASSATKVNTVQAVKSQVHFDLGEEDDDDVEDVEEEAWIDASGSNSPHISRKGSIASASNSRPETPNDHSQPPQLSTPERERVHHREYLTSRLLRRTPSHGAPPQMTAETARVAPLQLSSDDPHDASMKSGEGADELTSRFVEAAGSGLTSEGSFYYPSKPGSRRSVELAARSQSMANLQHSDDSGDGTPLLEHNDSALVPRNARRTAVPAAETSRTQQKLNLQRASSVLEPGQSVAGVGGPIGISRLIGVGGPGYDGASSRDLRVGRLLERTGMEYLVVRRYQNPIVRSLNRLEKLPSQRRTKRIPRSNTGSINSKHSADVHNRHIRNVSMPDARRPATPKHPLSVRTNGAGSSFDGEDESRLHERLSGSSLVGGEEEDGVGALLRNLWEKSLDLSASTD